MTSDTYPGSHGGQPDTGKVLSAVSAANRGRFETAGCYPVLLLAIEPDEILLPQLPGNYESIPPALSAWISQDKRYHFLCITW